MTSGERNLAVAVGTAVALLLLLLYPTSTNRTGHHRRPGEPLAPAGVVQVTPRSGTPTGG